MKPHAVPSLAAIRSFVANREQTGEPLPPQLAVTIDNSKTAAGLLHFRSKVGRCDATLLIDSGASYNFISSKFVQKNKMTTYQIHGPTVQLADGTPYPIQETIHTSLRIGAFLTKIEAYVLPLEGNDVILGAPWLHAHNPTIDWRNRHITLSQNGQLITLRPQDPPKLHQTKYLTALQVCHSMQRGAKLFLAVVRAQPEEEPPDISEGDDTNESFPTAAPGFPDGTDRTPSTFSPQE